jgi:hypothetical protein
MALGRLLGATLGQTYFESSLKSLLRCAKPNRSAAMTLEEVAVVLIGNPNRCMRPSYFQLQHIALLMAVSDADTRNAAIRSLNAYHLDKRAKEHFKQAVRRHKTVLNAVNYK